VRARSLGRDLDHLVRLAGTSRAEAVLEALERGEEGPFPRLSGAELAWVCRRSQLPSERLGELLHIPGRTVRAWRAEWREDKLARRNDFVWALHQEGIPVARIARVVGLSRQWVHKIARERKAGRRRYHRRLF
jgi:hypothetical protein